MLESENKPLCLARRFLTWVGFVEFHLVVIVLLFCFKRAPFVGRGPFRREGPNMARSNSPRLVLRGYFPHDSIVSMGLKPLLLLVLGLIQYLKSFPLP